MTLRRLVPIRWLAPCRVEHCGHAYKEVAVIGLRPTIQLKCCWCEVTVRIEARPKRVCYVGHGPGEGYDDVEYDIPNGWREE